MTSNLGGTELTLHLRDGESLLGGRREVDMIRANPSSQKQLELLGLPDALSSQLCGMEGGRYNDLSVLDVLLELCNV